MMTNYGRLFDYSILEAVPENMASFQISFSSDSAPFAALPSMPR